jgi:hypothetical protein
VVVIIVDVEKGGSIVDRDDTHPKPIATKLFKGTAQISSNKFGGKGAFWINQRKHAVGGAHFEGPGAIGTGATTKPDGAFSIAIYTTTAANFLKGMCNTHGRREMQFMRPRRGGEHQFGQWSRKDLLPDPGEVPQHRRRGYMPMVEQEDAPHRRRRKKRARQRGRQELEAEEEVAGIHATDVRRLFLENNPTFLRSTNPACRSTT